MKTLILILGVLTFSGCAVVEPLFQNFNVVSVPQEIELGKQAAQQVSKEMVLVQDSTLNAKVQSIGNKLVQALPKKEYNYEFYVVNDKSPNAFTIPGGKIYVHTGLINFAQSDAELAGVIAHEVGHAYQRHPAKSISRQYGVETLSQLLFSKNQPQIKAVALQIAKGSIVTHYGRQDEFEADEAGFYILHRSGIPVLGLVSFFERLQQLQGSGGTLAFLSTHPPTQERINRLRDLEAGRRQPTLVFAPLEQAS